MSELNIECRAVDSLRPHPTNPRTHSPKQVRQVARSICEFGWTNPIIVDDRGRIVAGHARIKAAKSLGIGMVPTIRIADLSETQIRAYVVADNRLAELGGWDQEILTDEIEFLSSLEIDFDVTITGFDTPEIDLLLDNGAGQDDDESLADVLSALRPEEPIVTRSGDLWTLGKHRIVCGDARSRLVYKKVLRDQHAQIVFTDPPYNVPISGHVSGHGEITHEEFQMASGEMSEEEYIAFLKCVLTRAWDGRRHDVLVKVTGFEYAGHHYENLSQIARAITGTRWSGPLFFGLKGNQK